MDRSSSTKGKVQAYVQFKQPMPKGFERLAPALLDDELHEVANHLLSFHLKHKNDYNFSVKRSL